MAGGSASALSLSRPAQASLTLRPIGSLSHPRRPLSRGSSPAGCPAEPLVSYRINRLFSGWNLPPLMIHAFGAHGHQATSRTRVGNRTNHVSRRTGARTRMGPLISAGRCLLHGFERLVDAERCGFLARRKRLESRQELSHHRLSRNQQERSIDEPPVVGTRFNVGTFERVGVNLE